MGKNFTSSKPKGGKGNKPYDRPKGGPGSSKGNKRKGPPPNRTQAPLNYARFCKQVMGFHNNFKRMVKLRRGQALASHAQTLKKCRLRLPNEKEDSRRAKLERTLTKLSAEFPVLKRLDRNKLADCLFWRLLQETGELDKLPALAKVVDSLNLCKDNFADIPVHLPEAEEDNTSPVPSGDKVEVDPRPKNVSHDAGNSAHMKKYLSTIFNEFRTNKKIRSAFGTDFKRIKSIAQGSRPINSPHESVSPGPTAKPTRDPLLDDERDETEASEPARTKKKDDGERLIAPRQADKKRVRSSESKSGKAYDAGRNDSASRKPKRSKNDSDASGKYHKRNDETERDIKGRQPENKSSTRKNSTDSASLHPSWEARRREREQQMLALKDPVKAKNTKIVFGNE
ncbi:hypothetical protein IWQ61_009643 [Dispira simplex]|nr:hypothetical protein IWQ61_009643 [Dispira simplex]